MNLPALLDVALGLVVVFFLLSSICSVLVELLARLRGWRNELLRRSIEGLINHPAVEREFWAHPLIRALGLQHARQPAYLSSDRFSVALVEVATCTGEYTSSFSSTAAIVAAIRADGAALARADSQGEVPCAAHPPVPDRELPTVHQMLLTFLRTQPRTTADPLSALRTSVAAWYDEVMERASGHYKTLSQRWLFVIGLAAAALLNVDTVRIVQILYHDPKLRQGMSEFAEKIVQDERDRTMADRSAASAADVATLRHAIAHDIRQLQALQLIGFPVGWTLPFELNFVPLYPTATDALTTDLPGGAPARGAVPAADRAGAQGKYWFTAIVMKVLGIVATGFAVCLGATFWYELLNKLVRLRRSRAEADTPPAPAAGTIVAAGVVAGTPRAGAPQALVAVAQPPLPAVTGEPPALLSALATPSTTADGAKAYWLGELANLAYVDEATRKRRTAEWGLEACEVIDAGDTQAFLAWGGGVAVLAFRGTETESLQDIQSDAKCRYVAIEGFAGRVHCGFREALDHVYPALRELLPRVQEQRCQFYITGHSLGAALATIAAFRLEHDAPLVPIHNVYTFGSPRVGDRDFARAYEATLGRQTIRVVNNEDLVTRVPPREMGYEHVGQILYIDELGRLQTDVGYWYRFLNFAANAVVNFKSAVTRSVKDHSMVLYTAQLKPHASAGRTVQPS